MFEQAFDEIIVTDEDWRMLRDEADQMMTAETAPAAGSSGGAPTGGDPQQAMMAAVQLLDSLPEGVRRAIGTALAQGATAEEIATELVQTAQQAQTQEQGNVPA
jgi:hypothetical protein